MINFVGESNASAICQTLSVQMAQNRFWNCCKFINVTLASVLRVKENHCCRRNNPQRTAYLDLSVFFGGAVGFCLAIVLNVRFALTGDVIFIGPPQRDPQ